MAWPVDDRDYDFSVLGQVPASTLNEIQDRIIDLHRSRTRVFWPTVAECEVGATGLMAWTPASSILPYLTCLYADRDLWIPIHLDETAIITDITAKVYKTADGICAKVDKLDCVFDTDAGVPVFSNLAGPAASVGGAPTWEVIDLSSPCPFTLAVDEMIFVKITTPDVGDHCAGAQVMYQPLTPT